MSSKSLFKTLTMTTVIGCKNFGKKINSMVL